MTDHEKIAKVAYYRWLAAGQPEGDGIDFWLEAEMALTTAEVHVEEVTDMTEKLHPAS